MSASASGDATGRSDEPMKPSARMNVRAHGGDLAVREAMLARREAEVDAREAALTQRSEAVRRILAEADERDAISDARDVSAEQRERALDLAQMLDTDRAYGDHWAERREAVLDRLHAKGDRTASRADRVDLARAPTGPLAGSIGNADPVGDSGHGLGRNRERLARDLNRVAIIGLGRLRFELTAVSLLVDETALEQITAAIHHVEELTGGLRELVVTLLDCSTIGVGDEDEIGSTVPDPVQALSDERTFLTTLSHELGNVTASIAGFTELLQDAPDGLSERQGQFVSAIRRNSDDLRALNADLLTLFSMDPSAALGAAMIGEVDLCAVVTATRDSLASAVTAPALDVSFKFPDRPVIVNGDPTQLKRMLSNLVNNAVKYTPPGGTVICALSQQDGHATLEVRDDGIGIPEEEQGKLFTRFFRASTATEHGIPGTGLGLAIVKSVVLNHSGTVVVSSALGTGTRFLVRLPVAGGHGIHAEPGVVHVIDDE